MAEYIIQYIAVLDILLGLINYTPKHFYLINYVILIGKYFIAKCKRNGINLLFNEYKYTLKWKLTLDKNVYLKRCKLHVFEEKFAILHDALRHIRKYKYTSRKSRDNTIFLLSNLYVAFFYTEQAMFKNNCCKSSFVLSKKIVFLLLCYIPLYNQKKIKYKKKKKLCRAYLCMVYIKLILSLCSTISRCLYQLKIASWRLTLPLHHHCPCLFHKESL